MAISEARKLALQKDQDMLLSMSPEADEARKAREKYVRERKAYIARGGIGTAKLIPKMPSVTDAERAGAARTQEILEIQKMKQKVLDNIQAYRETDNPLERMKLASTITKDFQASRAKVVAATVGEKGALLIQKMKSRDAVNLSLDKLESTYGMAGATAPAHAALKQFRKGVDDYSTTTSLDPDDSTNQQFLLQGAQEALAAVDDPAEQARLLAALDGEMVKKGFKPVTTFIQEGRARKANDGSIPVGERALNDLMMTTEGFDEAALGIASRKNQMDLSRQKLQKEIEIENKRIGGSAGLITDTLSVYREMNKELGVAGDGSDAAALKPFTDQIAELDKMITTLERPAFTDDYQRARAQLLAHPMFDDYLKMRGWLPGQEDEAIMGLIKEIKPMVQKQAAISRLSASIDPDDPRTAVGKVTNKIPLLSAIPMGERRREAVKRANELSPATGEAEGSRAETLKEVGAEGPSVVTRQSDARKAVGLDVDKTLFQMEGLTPTPAPVDKQMRNSAGGPVSQTTDELSPPGGFPMKTDTESASALAGIIPAVDSMPGGDEEEEEETGFVSKSAKNRDARMQSLKKITGFQPPPSTVA